MNKINLAIFASTKGTDLQAIIDAIKSNELPEADLKFVLSNKKDCYAMQRAEAAGIKTVFINAKGLSREEFDQQCLEACLEQKIDLIIFIGYMRLISGVLLDPYRNRIMNIHPSLLPKYPGMDLDVHNEVLANHETETGCTLHFVDEGMDTGPIILQHHLPIEPAETAEALKNKVQAEEQKVILEGIKLFSQDRLKVTGRQVAIV